VSEIVIKKRISLEFLGDDYKEAYLEFSAIPLVQYKLYTKKIAEAQGDDQKSADMIISILKDHFLGGEFPDKDGKLFEVAKDQFEQFDITTAVQVFKTLTGQSDPKVESV